MSFNSFLPTFLEILPNVNSLTASILTDTPDDLVRSLVFTPAAISFVPDGQTEQVSLPLPLATDPRSAAIIPSGTNTVDVKLSIRARDWESSFVARSVGDRKALQNLFQIQCHSCKNTFVPKTSCQSTDDQVPASNENVSPFTRLVDMPSEYWHELTDCWACHKEDFSQMPGQKGGVVLAQESTILIAKTYIVLHPKDIDISKLRVDLTSTRNVSYSEEAAIMFLEEIEEGRRFEDRPIDTLFLNQGVCVNTSVLKAVNADLLPQTTSSRNHIQAFPVALIYFCISNQQASHFL